LLLVALYMLNLNLRHNDRHRGLGGQENGKEAPKPDGQARGQLVRMCRMMLGMSQEKLGDALGITFQQVQKYEEGANRIGAGRLHHISHVLQVPVSFFFEGAPHVPDSPKATVVGRHHRPT
jgi:DNA-binding XRE family transcriptional regulator